MYDQWDGSFEGDEVRIICNVLNKNGIITSPIPILKGFFHVFVHSVQANLGNYVKPESHIPVMLRLKQMAVSKKSYLDRGQTDSYVDFLVEDDCLSLTEEIKHGMTNGLLPDFEGCSITHTLKKITVNTEELKKIFKIATGGWESTDDRLGSVFSDKIL